MNDPVMTIREVAQTLKLAEKTVYAMASEGELPAFKVRGQWRVLRIEFDAWLRGQSSVRSPSPSTAASSPTPEPPRREDDMTLVDESPRAVDDLTERVTQTELHRRMVSSLGSKVRSHSPLDAKPFEMDLAHPLPQRVRVYIYNATRPPGGRPLGEHKIQLMVPGQSRGERASFDNGDGRIVLLIGYAAEEDVFIVWDAGLYPDFAWSRNVQVKSNTITSASAGNIATQERQLRPASGRPAVETVLAVPARRLGEAIVRRMQLTRERMLRD